MAHSFLVIYCRFFRWIIYPQFKDKILKIDFKKINLGSHKIYSNLMAHSFLVIWCFSTNTSNLKKNSKNRLKKKEINIAESPEIYSNLMARRFLVIYYDQFLFFLWISSILHHSNLQDLEKTWSKPSKLAITCDANCFWKFFSWKNKKFIFFNDFYMLISKKKKKNLQKTSALPSSHT